MKSLARIARGASLGCLLLAGSAVAAPITFTWNPAATGLTGPGDGLIGPADNFTAVDNATIILGANGFTETGSLVVNNFILGSSILQTGGLQSNYNLLFGFSGSGGQVTVPSVGQSSTAAFTTLDYTMYGLAGATPSIGPGTDVSKIPGVIPLAFGSLKSGTATLTNVTPPPGVNGPLFSAKADLNLGITVCTSAGMGNTTAGNSLCTGDETAFFVNPSPGDFSLLIGDFSATTSVTTLVGNVLTINGGGGNLTFDDMASVDTTSVPEPGSLMVLGSGLLALGMVKRRTLS